MDRRQKGFALVSLFIVVVVTVSVVGGFFYITSLKKGESIIPTQAVSADNPYAPTSQQIQVETEQPTSGSFSVKDGKDLLAKLSNLDVGYTCKGVASSQKILAYISNSASLLVTYSEGRNAGYMLYLSDSKDIISYSWSEREGSTLGGPKFKIPAKGTDGTYATPGLVAMGLLGGAILNNTGSTLTCSPGIADKNVLRIPSNVDFISVPSSTY